MMKLLSGLLLMSIILISCNKEEDDEVSKIDRNAVIEDIYCQLVQQGIIINEDLEAFKQNVFDAEAIVDISTTVAYNSATNKTEKNIFISTNSASIQNISIFEYVPKDVAQSASEIEFEIEPTQIINDDPLIMWHLGEEANQQIIELFYSINGEYESTGETIVTTSDILGVEKGTFTDARDGKTYKTVKIGAQTWMAENLAYLPNVSPSSSGPATASSSGSNTKPYYYVCEYSGYDVSAAKETENYGKYGVLYTWPAALTACPDGWHIPSDDEWKQMEMFIGMSPSEADGTEWRGTDEGSKLKATSGWNELNGIDGNGTDNYGFSALPGGYCIRDGFRYVGERGYWWSATEYGSNNVWFRFMPYSNAAVNRTNADKGMGFSVRCVRD